MGHTYNVACHIKGNRNFLFDIQKEYFIALNQPRNYMFIASSCIDREEYICCGQTLWHSFTFIPIQENQVDGKFIKHDVKWGLFCHQWELLSEILTKFNYSWQHILADGYGYEERTIDITSNKNSIKSFDNNVQSYFIIDGTRIEPIGLKFIEIDEIWGDVSNDFVVG